MGELVGIVTGLHRSTRRDYLGRMVDRKVHCMEVASRYGQDYWDGDRCYGYGGYRYDGRWKPVAQALAERYALDGASRVLDVGCGKAYLLHELQGLVPGLEVHGFDASEYALGQALEGTRERLSLHRAEDAYPFPDGYFDLVLSLTTLHNLPLPELDRALREIERVGRRKYVVVESYRNAQELFNLQCWALTCESFLAPGEWRWMFERSGYTGDYEFIYFE